MSTIAAIKPPPYLYLSNIAEHCPKAMAVYLMIWRDMDHNYQLTVEKDLIKPDFLVSAARFKNDLYLLLKEGLLSFHETPEQIFIEVTGWDEFMDDEEEYG